MKHRLLPQCQPYAVVVGNGTEKSFGSLYDAVAFLKASSNTSYLRTPDGSRWGASLNGVVQFRLAKAAHA